MVVQLNCYSIHQWLNQLREFLAIKITLENAILVPLRAEFDGKTGEPVVVYPNFLNAVKAYFLWPSVSGERPLWHNWRFDVRAGIQRSHVFAYLPQYFPSALRNSLRKVRAFNINRPRERTGGACAYGDLARSLSRHTTCSARRILNFLPSRLTRETFFAPTRA